MTQRRVAILISGGGSNMAALVRDMQDPDHPARPCLVLSNRPDAAGLARAADLGVPTAAIDHRAHADDRTRFETAMIEPLKASGAEILCLAGFMRILTPEFVGRWRGRILNIHPSILPLFPGLDTHRRALEAGMAVHGATVHEVTPDLDAGPILGQAVIPVHRGRYGRGSRCPAPADGTPALSGGAAPLRDRRPDQAMPLSVIRPVSTIRNLGPRADESFARAGLASAEEVIECGADTAYLRLLQTGTRAHFIGYYALVLGLQDRPWTDLAAEEKAALRIRFDALKASVPALQSARSELEAALDRIGVRELQPTSSSPEKK